MTEETYSMFSTFSKLVDSHIITQWLTHLSKRFYNYHDLVNNYIFSIINV